MHSRSIAPLMSSRSPLIRVPSTLDSAVPASQIEFVTGHVVVVAAIRFPSPLLLFTASCMHGRTIFADESWC